jgi:hypothetical protein
MSICDNYNQMNSNITCFEKGSCVHAVLLLAAGIGFGLFLATPAVAGTMKSEATETVDPCESAKEWEVGGAQISLETSPEFVKEGSASLKIVFPIDHTEVEGWQSATRRSLHRGKPKEIIFWVKPDAPYLSPQILDSDGTQVGIDVEDLKVGEWNLVSLEVDSMPVINPGDDGMLSDMNNLILAVHPNKTGLRDSQDYIYYIDDIKMVPSEEKVMK